MPSDAANSIRGRRSRGRDEALKLEFRQCEVATPDSSEEGRICLANGIVFAVLARLGGDVSDDKGWYLLTGFGPCEQEGIIFKTLDEAGEWIRDRIAADWPHQGGP